MEGFDDLAGYDKAMYIPDPDNLETCKLCGRTFDRSILGEAIEHLHDDSLPLLPIMYEIRGKRLRYEEGDDTDRDKLRFDLEQLIISLSRKYRGNPQNDQFISFKALDSDEHERTITITAPGRDKLALSSIYVISVDGQEAGTFTYDVTTGEGDFEGEMDEELEEVAFQWVINLSLHDI